MGQFATTLDRVSDLVSAVGFKEDPTPHDKPGESAVRMDKSFRSLIRGVRNTNKMSDRTIALVRLDLAVRLVHRMRIGSDGKLDLKRAANDYETVMAAIMGDSTLNALGHVNFTDWPVKTSRTGEHIECDVRFAVLVEMDWALSAEP